MDGLQPTQITFFMVLWFAAIVAGGMTGGAVGSSHFGIWGGIVGGIVGVVVGHVIGVVPDWLSTKLMFRHLARSSDERLWKIVNLGSWNFYQTMALLQLAARGQNVRTQLPRIVKMLESDDELERVYGWDGLRIVFPEETKVAADYDPRAASDDCRSQIAKLKATL
jgi:hypothetical protein